MSFNEYSYITSCYLLYMSIIHQFHYEFSIYAHDSFEKLMNIYNYKLRV